jgi:hypothetical protein
MGFSQIDKGTIAIESSPAIKTIVTKRINYNKSNPKIDGYRIQLFNGSESGAVNTRNRFSALFPNTATSIDWDSPEWKVRVGKYKTRLAVDKAVDEIKKAFGNAIVVEMRIRL